MSAVYERELLLGSAHVDCFRRLRTSVLFDLLQEASIRHTEALGFGREKTLDRGLAWVVTRQHVLVERMPVFDERIVVRSWPGETMHLLFPRYYELLDAHGETLLRGSALWSLMDQTTRSAVFPDEYGIEIKGVQTGRETPYLVRLRTLETPNESPFRVPYSYVDLNGHMNNTRYFDLTDDLLPAVHRGEMLCEANVEYCAEAKLGEELHIAWGEEAGVYYVNGSKEHACFRMNLHYAEGRGDA
ncbi:MAG: hypothetical protein E7425_09640 [Ruminococcaceae bacterium]|jgi:acyl-ACP thioesterase|nr:hypothetical protein [Oscillospiraceae bacterium]